MIGFFMILLAWCFFNDLDNQSREYINFIVKGIKYMSLLFDGLFFYVKVSNMEFFVLELFNLNIVVRNVLEILDVEIEDI